MNFEVEVTFYFKKQAKRLAKKYPSLPSELRELISSLEKSPAQGTMIGRGCYKIRLSIASKSKGKSGGGRVITHLQVSKKKVYLLSIYDKSEMESITPSDLSGLLKLIP
ncbi:MAG: type II toxin-antitoxin system RelE/ParE family toxin [Cyclobacteriaceae bacterium]|nr:type II toxin-antitoxin system RelE/ParE family toxin [Cyclobacteriaceae bacterium]